MKIAYLGKIQLSDIDLSLLHESQQLADITYIIEVNPRFQQGPAFNIPAIYPKSGLFKATAIYPEEFERLRGFIDLEKCYVLNTCGKLWLLKSFWTHALLLWFLMRQKFDIIHLVWPPNIYEFVLYALRTKMLLTVHDPIPHSGLNTFIVRLRRKIAFRLIPQLLILNNAQRKEFIDYYGISPKRVVASRLSCYTYLQTVRPDTQDIPPEGSFILFVGKISRYKGLDYLLPAMKQVHQHCPDCKLIVAGGGNYHFDISEYKSLDYIDLRNRFIPDSELVALIGHSAFMVCPYTDATQSGVVMSAFAFGKPVIATNVGGLPEMVADRRHGLIIKEKDVETLSQSITSMWLQRDMVEQFASNIRNDYSSGNLSWRKIANDIIKTYNQRYKE